jgi:hypothetical protein
MGLEVRVQPRRQEFGEILQRATQHGAALHLLMTGSVSATYNYQEQFEEVFGACEFAGPVTTHYRALFNHTFTELWMQQQLIDALEQWLQESVAPTAE